MGMGASYDPSAMQAQTQANLERERQYRKQEAESARNARLEEEKLRLSLERAAREEQYAAMQAEKMEIEEKEEEAIQEQVAQTNTMDNVMGFFSERPGVQINRLGEGDRPS